MNFWKKTKHFYLYCQNKFEQLWENREHILTIIDSIAPFIILGMIFFIVVKSLITVIHFLHGHFAEFIFIGFILLALFDCRDNQAKKNPKKDIHTHYKVNPFSTVHKVDFFESKIIDLVLVIASIFPQILPREIYIVLLVNRALFDLSRGNPLHLKEKQYHPIIYCRKENSEQEQYNLKIKLDGFTAEQIKSLTPIISSALIGNVKNFAVTASREDEAHNFVTFIIEDVTINYRLVFSSVNEMYPMVPAKLCVDKRATIDLITSGSILVAGKTRSGKTTGIISILLQALLDGRDSYGSEIVIIDPKQAELSRLPYVITLDEDGGGRAILATLQKFASAITERQAVLNTLADTNGDVVHWWEAGMSVSFLFIDEYVSCRTLFPKRAEKNEPEYCLATFDALLKRIITMGASAGCYAIISIAEASVEEGGLPSMLRSAMSTRILFRPTMPEAKLLWSTDKLLNMPDKTYSPGDAWFSSTDGKHDEVSFVRFPQMKFPVYKELGRLLTEYYSETGASGGAEREPSAPAPPPGAAGST